MGSQAGPLDPWALLTVGLLELNWALVSLGAQGSQGRVFPGHPRGAQGPQWARPMGHPGGLGIIRYVEQFLRHLKRCFMLFSLLKVLSSLFEKGKNCL